MLTIENIHEFRVLERTTESIMIYNQRVLETGRFQNTTDYYFINTGLEWMMVRAEKKLKVPMIPYKNDSKWS